MNNNWQNIHYSFTEELQNQWENNGFSYHQTKEWIDIGLLPTDANFCRWLSNEGYTALAVLNYGDEQVLRNNYQRSLIKQPLFNWYTDNKLTLTQVSLLSHKLGIQANNDYSWKEITNLLITTPFTKPNYPLTKLIIALTLTALIIYLLTN